MILVYVRVCVCVAYGLFSFFLSLSLLRSPPRGEFNALVAFIASGASPASSASHTSYNGCYRGQERANLYAARRASPSVLAARRSWQAFQILGALRSSEALFDGGGTISIPAAAARVLDDAGLMCKAS